LSRNPAGCTRMHLEWDPAAFVETLILSESQDLYQM
jgi:hypothetical protein